MRCLFVVVVVASLVLASCFWVAVVDNKCLTNLVNIIVSVGKFQNFNDTVNDNDDDRAKERESELKQRQSKERMRMREMDALWLDK